MQQWHSSSGDPIYAVGSFYYADRKYPDANVTVAALESIESLIPRADAGAHGWKKSDAAQLRRIAAFIRKDLRGTMLVGKGRRGGVNTLGSEATRSPNKIGHSAGKLPTFREARTKLFADLAARGWKQTGASSLKTPHWTSPDGSARLWFLPQAVWFTNSDNGRHDFKNARSVHADIRQPRDYAHVLYRAGKVGLSAGAKKRVWLANGAVPTKKKKRVWLANGAVPTNVGRSAGRSKKPSKSCGCSK